MSRRLTLGAIAVFSAGCSAPGARLASTPDTVAVADQPPPPGIFTTNSTSYTAAIEQGNPIPRYGFTVVTRYTNPTSSPIYLARCFPTSPTPIYGVLLVDKTDSRGSAYSLAWGCVGHNEQILVAPGATRIDTLHLSGPNFSSSAGVPFGITEGRMRLSYGPQTCNGDRPCDITADSLRYSNPFTVHLSK